VTVLSLLLAAGVPVFSGFESDSYQMHDRTIAEAVAEFNQNRATWVGGTPEQGMRVPDITAAQIKAQMIQESGGSDVKSRAAWRCDPLQVNVPGDWQPYKRYLGLRKPRRVNDGSPRTNVRAGLMYLARKGFGVSGQPAANRPEAVFDGWKTALERYNGRTDKLADGKAYREAYAARILKRAKDPRTQIRISIK